MYEGVKVLIFSECSTEDQFKNKYLVYLSSGVTNNLAGDILVFCNTNNKSCPWSN